MIEKKNRKPQNTDNILIKILSMLNSREQKSFFALMILSIITAFIQSAGIASFFPFMNLLLDMNSIHSNKYLHDFYIYFGFRNDQDFVVFVGTIVGSMIILSSFFTVLTKIMKSKFLLSCSHNISKNLLKHYLNKPYEFILNKNSSELVKGVLSDVSEFTNSYLNGIIEFSINLIMMISILMMLLFVNLKSTLLIIGFFVFLYGGLTLFSKSKLKKSGIKVLNAKRDKHKYAYEALNGFKISKAFGIEDYFIERYSKASQKAEKYQLLSKIISDIPKHIVEALVFGGLTVAIVIIILQRQDISKIIPMMSVYIVAGYRIMPEIAKIFSSISSTIHNRPVVDKLYDEFIVQNETETLNTYTIENKISNISEEFKDSIKLTDIVFKYESSDVVINHINLEIRKGTVIGFAGTTGAGKTTLIDIIMGLLPPQSGSLSVDGVTIDRSNVREWRKQIGYVPQDIFLIDDTVRANIAFGIPKELIDDVRITTCAKMAAISNFIEEDMPQKYYTMIGERGVRLSGGQRQRIGLARALYRNPSILILDEATSALDGATEETVVKGIHNHSQVKTIIIIAHRLNTLKPCDQIYLLEKGKIIDHGSYNDLVQKSPQFRMMAKLETDPITSVKT